MAVGTVNPVIGNVKVVGFDGVACQALVGDEVFAKDAIQTAANAVVQVQLENGRTLDLGRDSKIALDDDVLNVGQDRGTTRAHATGDIAALQAQIAAGADLSSVIEATVAGGAPGACPPALFVITASYWGSRQFDAIVVPLYCASSRLPSSATCLCKGE